MMVVANSEDKKVRFLDQTLYDDFWGIVGWSKMLNGVYQLTNWRYLIMDIYVQKEWKIDMKNYRLKFSYC